MLNERKQPLYQGLERLFEETLDLRVRYIYKKLSSPGSQAHLLDSDDIHKCLPCLQEICSGNAEKIPGNSVPGAL